MYAASAKAAVEAPTPAMDAVPKQTTAELCCATPDSCRRSVLTPAVVPKPAAFRCPSAADIA
jgi:hypothetical protein